MQIVAVILASAAARLGGSSGLTISQAFPPAIVGTNAQEQIAAVVVQRLSKVLGTSADIEVGVTAISSRGATTLVFSDLHKTLFTGASYSVRVAGTLLHSERCEHDRRNAKLSTILLK